LSPYTVKGHWATLSAFFSWLEKEELLTENPMRRIARPKVPTKIKAAFAAQEIRDLLKACDAKWAGRGIRDRAMILFLLDTGCRVSELCGVPLADVDFPAGRVKVKGKGAKERFVYISQTTARVLLKYVHEHRPQTTAPHLFLSHEGQPLNRYSVASLLYRLGAKAGVPHVHAHRFRHTAAIQFLRNGSDIFHLQRMLGHTTLEMVKTYVALADADVARAHQKASPVENWGLR
jgi:site-specific recombinase XerD